MKSSKSEQKSLQDRVSRHPENPVLTTVHQLSNWLDQNLEIMLHENRDWQTVTGNVQHFGRQPRKDAA